ncbi:universal stress protein [Halosimplex salinum]|uniref:universal stress protein n=1 Tax=Halosimplex salinum TaxID=1710538 RepID=UPI000F4A844F|nr:universal stress protein [Halosimplex salinum]
MTETILLSLGGSDPSGEAIDHALAMAERHGGTVHALYVVDTGRYGEPALSSAEILVDDVEDQGHDLLRSIADRGRERGVAVTTRCCHGRPNEELPAYAARIGADTVVLGGRRLPGRVRRELDRTADIVVPGAATVGR